MQRLLVLGAMALITFPAAAADSDLSQQLGGHWAGLTALVIIEIGYAASQVRPVFRQSSDHKPGAMFRLKCR